MPGPKKATKVFPRISNLPLTLTDLVKGLLSGKKCQSKVFICIYITLVLLLQFELQAYKTNPGEPSTSPPSCNTPRQQTFMQQQATFCLLKWKKTVFKVPLLFYAHSL